MFSVSESQNLSGGFKINLKYGARLNIISPFMLCVLCERRQASCFDYILP